MFWYFECAKFEPVAMCRHFQLELSTQAFLKKSATLLPIPHLCHILRLSWLEVNFCIHVKKSSKINLMFGWWVQSMAHKIYSCYFMHHFCWFICFLENGGKRLSKYAGIKLYLKLQMKSVYNVIFHMWNWGMPTESYSFLSKYLLSRNASRLTLH